MQIIVHLLIGNIGHAETPIRSPAPEGDLLILAWQVRPPFFPDSPLHRSGLGQTPHQRPAKTVFSTVPSNFD